jgi:undecaprenyl-diphosphatase
VPFAALVAASRVVLGLHYPSDVAAGAIIGAALAVLSMLVVP